MQTWCAQLHQAFTQLHHHLLTKSLDGFGIIAKTGEFEQYPTGDFRAAGL